MLPDPELIAQSLHEDWMAAKAAQGISTRPHPQTGDEQMLPWDQLTDTVKEENRRMVRAVYAEIYKHWGTVRRT
jgi:hypothetical protein